MDRIIPGGPLGAAQVLPLLEEIRPARTTLAGKQRQNMHIKIVTQQ